MGLLEKLKSAIGLDSSGSRAPTGAESARRDVDVTVEREPETPSDPDPANEAAVKGTTDVASNESTTAPPDASDRGAAEASTTTADSTTDAATEAGEQTPSADATAPSAERGASEGDAGDDGDASSPSVPAPDRPVDSLSGIGPAYAARLAEVGVETVGDLVETGAETVGAETDLSEKRVAGWIEQARDADD
jgi:predicted flap endonuclease-1-like 5' DNA nuclease